MTIAYAIVCGIAIFVIILVHQYNDRMNFLRIFRPRRKKAPPKTDGFERRKDRRHYGPVISISVYDPIQQDTVPGKLKDCSERGAGLLLDGLVMQGRTLLLDVEEFRIPVRVRHSTRVNGVNITGVEIIGEPPTGWFDFINEDR